jgi:predicted MFS family arabinose efflux permease
MAVRFSYQLVFIFLVRLLLNTGRRFIYPFAPALSRSLDVPLTAITTIIASTQLTSLLGLFSGPLADRMGNRVVMRTGLASLSIGMLLCGLVAEYWAVFIGLVLASFGKTIFDPAIQSFIGKHVSFSQRGRVIGIIETSWAGSALIGIPAFALIVENIGLQISFYVLAFAGAVGWLMISKILSEDEKNTTAQGVSISILSGIHSLFRKRSTAGMLLFGFWISLANDGLFVVYGLWLEESFQVSLVTLGFSTIAIGCAELLGESITALFSDKIGLKRTIIMSLCLVSGAYFILPMLGGSLGFALAGMFFVFLFFEIVMVTSVSLSTELLPGARATMMSGFYALCGIGRMVGVLGAGLFWKIGGIQMVAWSSACFTILGLISLLWGMSRWRIDGADREQR